MSERLQQSEHVCVNLFCFILQPGTNPVEMNETKFMITTYEEEIIFIFMLLNILLRLRHSVITVNI